MRILKEQNDQFTHQWATQGTIFAKVLEKSGQPPKDIPKYKRIKLPKFSGNTDEDINEFVMNYDRAAKFHRWDEERKAEALPLHLLGKANVWFNTTPDIAEEWYATITEALKH